MGRTNYTLGRAPFVAQHGSLTKNDGRQIDWDQVLDKYRSTAVQVDVNGAVAKGATSITVDALPGAVPLNAILDFGEWAAVTVTIADASISDGDTTLAVAALSGPLPAGTVLTFTDGMGGGSDAVVVLTAAAAAAATSITVAPMDTTGLPADTEVATFPGGRKLAKVTAAAAAAATTLSVEALTIDLEDDDQAHYYGTGAKTIQAGTVMAQLSGGKLVPRADRPGSETATCILECTAVEGEKSDALSGYGCIIGGVIYENLLPEQSSGTINSTYKTELQTAGVGTGFAFLQYADNRS